MKKNVGELFEWRGLLRGDPVVGSAPINRPANRKLDGWVYSRTGQLRRKVEIGERFGDLTVLGEAPKPARASGVFVFVRCSCGTESRMRLGAIIRKNIQRCGLPGHYDARVTAAGDELVGQKFGLLIVTSACIDRMVSPCGSRAAQVVTRCECGVERLARVTDLKRGNVQSCGGDIHSAIKPQFRKWTVSGKPGTYALEAVGTQMIKIGAARNLKSRLKKLQSSSPVELRAFAYSPDNLEHRLHLMLGEHRAHGEWFRANDEVLSVISAHLSPVNVSVIGEISRARRHRCKRCGGLGHHAKTCKVPADVQAQ